MHGVQSPGSASNTFRARGVSGHSGQRYLRIFIGLHFFDFFRQKIKDFSVLVFPPASM
jgi:hypothetical protein